MSLLNNLVNEFIVCLDFDYDKYQKIIDSYDSAKSTTFNESDNESAMTSHHKQVVIEMPNQRLGDMQGLSKV